ncbi:Aldedh domain-containing protein [Mycena chlorophos]|uniref:Aldedh domain-containing protein n=1 Tax=Mycena chlorophos TaxID=658473 RepID=A0A8H6WPR8_MYCCL|nr:Aldedh domain-containing protein [Mycena chlorophos]
MADSFLSLILNPVIALNPFDDGNRSGIDITYVLGAFVALGIWLVSSRYHRAMYAAVPFKYPPLEEAEPTYQSFIIEKAHLNSHLDNPELATALPVKGARYITCFDPSTGMHLATLKADSEEEIAHKIRLAQVAQKGWRDTSFGRRRRVMRSLNKWLVENQDVCARTACRDTGKTLVDAALGEIITTCCKLQYMIDHGERALRPETRHGNLILAYKTSQVVYEPLGVVAAIVSWNYPLHNSWSPIIAALFAGNGIVLKCSEHVFWSTQWFVGCIRKCLATCGYDPELVQLVCCYPEQADALTRSPHIKHITFIGSETVGRKIAIAATEHLTPVTLELGGKDPAVIMKGTDLNKWASMWMRGIFQNVGQNCIGIERLIVHKSQHDELYDMLQKRIEMLRLGSVLAPSDAGFVNTVDCGAMISGDRFTSLTNIIQEADNAGSDVHGGEPYAHVYQDKGYYFKPTIVGPVKPEMRIAQEELFAPVATLIPYDTVEEAIEIANGTRYGLGASVFGPSQDQCLEVAKRLECGMVSVNDFAVFYLNQDLPFGGFKASGYGRFGGPEGLRALTNVKAIMVDRFPHLIQTDIPKVLDYPIRSLVGVCEWSGDVLVCRRMAEADWRTLEVDPGDTKIMRGATRKMLSAVIYLHILLVSSFEYCFHESDSGMTGRWEVDGRRSAGIKAASVPPARGPTGRDSPTMPVANVTGKIAIQTQDGRYLKINPTNGLEMGNQKLDSHAQFTVQYVNSNRNSKLALLGPNRRYMNVLDSSDVKCQESVPSKSLKFGVIYLTGGLVNFTVTGLPGVGARTLFLSSEAGDAKYNGSLAIKVWEDQNCRFKIRNL